MPNIFTLPPTGFGPGSQPTPSDGAPSYLSLPQGMRTYIPHVPDLADAGADAGSLDTARERAFVERVPALGAEAAWTAGVVNAPPLLAELLDKSAAWVPGGLPHVVNLTLLPHTPEDLLWLDAALGKGSVIILSRGYGNCRVTATAIPFVWRVQFFNSMDTLILDTFEVTELPEVALAAREDMADSARRIRDILEMLG